MKVIPSTSEGQPHLLMLQCRYFALSWTVSVQLHEWGTAMLCCSCLEIKCLSGIESGNLLWRMLFLRLTSTCPSGWYVWFSAGSSGFQLWSGSFQDLVNWYCCLVMV